MASLASLHADLAALLSVRAKGLRSVQHADGRRLEYRSDAELAAAIADLERRIAEAQHTRVSTIRFSPSKGT